MSSFGFIELIFVFGIALALALRELTRIRRDVRQMRDRMHDEKSDDA